MVQNSGKSSDQTGSGHESGQRRAAAEPLAIGRLGDIRWLAAGCGLLFGLKVWFGFRLDLYSDEVFYWLAATEPAPAYSDLPFLTALLAGAGSALDPGNPLATRSLFLISGSLLPAVVYWLALPFSGRRDALQAAFLSICIPLGGFLGLLAVPDVPMLLCGLLSLGCLDRALRGDRTCYWLGCGVFMALGLCTHYRFILYPAGAFAFLLFSWDTHTAPLPSSHTPNPSSDDSYPSSGAPNPSSLPSSGAPYTSSGAPYPSSGAPYPSSCAPYPSSGAPYPSSCAKSQDLHGMARSKSEDTQGDSATTRRMTVIGNPQDTHPAPARDTHHESASAPARDTHPESASRRSRWRNPGPWIAGGIAALGLLPLAWANLSANLGSASFYFLERHPWQFDAAGLLHIPIQSLLVTPPLYALLLYSAWLTYKSGDKSGDTHSSSGAPYPSSGAPYPSSCAPYPSSCAKSQDLHGMARSNSEDTQGDSATTRRMTVTGNPQDTHPASHAPYPSSCAKSQDLHGMARSKSEDAQGDSATTRRMTVSGNPQDTHPAPARDTHPADSRHAWLLLWFSLPHLLAYALLAPWADASSTTAHWPLPGYFPLLVFAPEALRRLRGRLLRHWRRKPAEVAVGAIPAIGFAGAVLALAGIGSQSWQIQLQPVLGDGVLSEKMAGWGEFNERSVRLLAEDFEAAPAVVTDNYYTMAQLQYVGTADDAYTLDRDKAVRDGRYRQLELWQRSEVTIRQRAGEAMLFITEDSALDVEQKHALVARACGLVDALEQIDQLSLFNGDKRFSFYRGQSIRPAGAAMAQPCPYPPRAWIDQPSAGATLSGVAVISGWAYNEDLGVAGIRLYLDGEAISEAEYGLPRPDVVEVTGLRGEPNQPGLGFRAIIDTSAFGPGRHEFAIGIIDSRGFETGYGRREVNFADSQQ